MLFNNTKHTKIDIPKKNINEKYLHKIINDRQKSKNVITTIYVALSFFLKLQQHEFEGVEIKPGSGFRETEIEIV